MDQRRTTGVYIISVAASLIEVHPRTLRIYESYGLVTPIRRKHLRLYSDADIERLRLIRRLMGGAGVNIAGVRILMALFDAGHFTFADVPGDTRRQIASSALPDASGD
jgi:DNA-binding transcriptional MerR regulator